MTEATKEVKKVHPMQAWKNKSALATKVVKFDDFPINIRELSGKEKIRFGKIKDEVKCAFFLWNTCINSQTNPEWEFSLPDFLLAYNYNSTEISAVLEMVVEFSGLSDEAQEKLEKN